MRLGPLSLWRQAARDADACDNEEEEVRSRQRTLKSRRESVGERSASGAEDSDDPLLNEVAGLARRLAERGHRRSAELGILAYESPQNAARSYAGAATSPLLSSIDDALRSLDAAIAEEEVAEAAGLGSEDYLATDEEESLSSAPLDPLFDDSWRAFQGSSLARMDGCFEEPQFADEATDSELIALRRSGALWIANTLKSCLRSRLSSSWAQWVRTGHHRGRRTTLPLSSSSMKIWRLFAEGQANAPEGACALASALERLERRRRQWRIASALHRWRNSSCFEPPSTPSAPSPRMALRALRQQDQDPRDQLVAIEAENRMLRQTLAERRLLYDALLPVALRAQEAKARGFRALSCHAEAARRLAGARQELRRREVALNTDLAPRRRQHALIWMARVLEQAELKLCGWAWQRLRSKAEFMSGLRAMEQALVSCSARVALGQAAQRTSAPGAPRSPQDWCLDAAPSYSASPWASAPGQRRASWPGALEVFASGSSESWGW